MEEIELLRRNARSMVRELGLLNDAYFEIGVTLAERHLLIELNSYLYPTVGEIAERLLLDKSTASRLISKAVQKGYVEYSFDENDKRKRYLQLTVKGREILDAFEPIAFNQTKDALLTLTEDEIDKVYQGIALYARGLKNSRLRSKVAITAITEQDNASLAHLLADIHKNFPLSQWNNLFDAYQGKDRSYYVMKMEGTIIGGAGIAPRQNLPNVCELQKICLQPDLCESGFEKILIDSCIAQAKEHGYDQCFVDLAKENQFPLTLFQELGFQTYNKKNKNELLVWKAC